MCARFTLRTSVPDVMRVFRLAAEPRLKPRYNVAPGQPVAIVRLTGGGERILDLARWGLVPSWAREASIGAKLLNARAEGVFGAPAFRAAVRDRRCLVPADGFYEWSAEGRVKRPFLFALRDGAPFAFAGLHEHWTAKDGTTLETVAILTTDANELVAPVHDRMPVILEPAQFALWLDPLVRGRKPLAGLLRPFPADRMCVEPASPRVNDPRNDDARCLEPVGRQLELGF